MIFLSKDIKKLFEFRKDFDNYQIIKIEEFSGNIRIIFTRNDRNWLRFEALNDFANWGETIECKEV